MCPKPYQTTLSTSGTRTLFWFIYKLATIFLQLVAKRQPNDFFNFEPQIQWSSQSGCLLKLLYMVTWRDETQLHFTIVPAVVQVFDSFLSIFFIAELDIHITNKMISKVVTHIHFFNFSILWKCNDWNTKQSIKRSKWQCLNCTYWTDGGHFTLYIIIHV